MSEGRVGGYYDDKLTAEQLRRCYDIATPRVRRYLENELKHVLQHVHSGDMVLELGCGYGRVLSILAGKAGWIIGIDTSIASLRLGRETLLSVPNCILLQMDAVQLAFRSRIFDTVICIQNGISAFHVDQRDLIRESVRVAKPGGTILFSSYSDRFWEDRLEWFRLQAKAGLLGEIDYEKTGDGRIVCKDGFTATTVRPEQFTALTSDLDVDVQIMEVGESSIFCVIKPI